MARFASLPVLNEELVLQVAPCWLFNALSRVNGMDVLLSGSIEEAPYYLYFSKDLRALGSEEQEADSCRVS